MVLSNML